MVNRKHSLTEQFSEVSEYEYSKVARDIVDCLIYDSDELNRWAYLD